jgi:hypothetical protein
LIGGKTTVYLWAMVPRPWRLISQMIHIWLHQRLSHMAPRRKMGERDGKDEQRSRRQGCMNPPIGRLRLVMAVIDLPLTSIPIWIFTAPMALTSYLMINSVAAGPFSRATGSSQHQCFVRLFFSYDNPLCGFLPRRGCYVWRSSRGRRCANYRTPLRRPISLEEVVLKVRALRRYRTLKLDVKRC